MIEIEAKWCVNSKALLFQGALKWEGRRPTSPTRVQKSWPSHLPSKLNQEQISDFPTPGWVFLPGDHTEGSSEITKIRAWLFRRVAKASPHELSQTFYPGLGQPEVKVNLCDDTSGNGRGREQQEFGFLFKYLWKTTNESLQDKCSSMWCWDIGMCVEHSIDTKSSSVVGSLSSKNHSWWDYKTSPKTGGKRIKLNRSFHVS